MKKAVVIDTNSLSYNNICSIVRNHYRDESFDILSEMIDANEIIGKTYDNIKTFSEVQKSAWIDGFNLNQSYILTV